jgi:hypothetical protein
MALLLLFVFALMASGYVLKEGLRKKEKTTHELLLKCVIIITSVVPRQLPMQVRMRGVWWGFVSTCPRRPFQSFTGNRPAARLCVSSFVI